jgi:hypothetical protein
MFEGPHGSKEGKLRVGKCDEKGQCQIVTFRQETKMSLEVVVNTYLNHYSSNIQ